ncbi:MAG: hypothetical protein IJR28_04155 [Ottowia sp.]|nr:hypothetical protein [Ottowia sp.]
MISINMFPNFFRRSPLRALHTAAAKKKAVKHRNGENDNNLSMGTMTSAATKNARNSAAEATYIHRALVPLRVSASMLSRQAAAKAIVPPINHAANAGVCASITVFKSYALAAWCFHYCPVCGLFAYSYRLHFITGLLHR